MECKNCPYGKDDFERRMACYNKIVEENGTPNDIYRNLTPEEAAEEFEKFLWCDKVGGKVYVFGHCEDFSIDIPEEENFAKKKRKNKRERDLKYKNHLKFLAKNIKKYPSPATLVDKYYVNGYGYVENIKPYHKRLYLNHHNCSYYKKLSNRKIRKYEDEIHNGGSYKKIYDYHWSVT